MASYKTVFGSYLKTEDLQDRPVPVVVEHVSLETMKGQDGQPDKRVLVAHFKGKDKGLVLNKTRCEQMADVFGTDDYEMWGGPAMLVPGTTKFGGKTVPCIDVKPRVGAKAAAAPPPPEPEPASDVDEDSIPF